jgi:hypothetical protein
MSSSATTNSSHSQPCRLVPLKLALPCDSKASEPHATEYHGSQIEIIAIRLAPATIRSTWVRRRRSSWNAGPAPADRGWRGAPYPPRMPCPPCMPYPPDAL